MPVFGRLLGEVHHQCVAWSWGFALVSRMIWSSHSSVLSQVARQTYGFGLK